MPIKIVNTAMTNNEYLDQFFLKIRPNPVRIGQMTKSKRYAKVATQKERLLWRSDISWFEARNPKTMAARINPPTVKIYPPDKLIISFSMYVKVIKIPGFGTN
jgi:hypothetical protein